MARELHKKGNKYAIYSCTIEEYITPFLDKKLIKKIWAYDLIEEAIEKAEKYMNDGCYIDVD